jgi:uncharacterized protein (DUF1778 family)
MKSIRAKRRRSRAKAEPDLDRCVFLLDARAHEKFLAMLNKPTKPTEELRARMNRKPPWES